MKWGKLPTSFHSRLSVIKMNVLPRLNFISSMIPLAPPNNYWKKLHSIINQFLWNKKKPRIKTSTLQRHKSAGGVNLPNFEWYSWSFVLRPLAVWLNPNSQVSWLPIEEKLTSPYSLHNLIHSNISHKLVKRDFGPIISYLFTMWLKVQQFAKIHSKIFRQSPIFHNFSLLIDGKPISFPQWSDKGVNTLQDIIGIQGLLEFRELQKTFDLPGTFFFYLQLRAAMRAQGVPWNSKLEDHPFHIKLNTKGKNKGIASELYKLIVEASYKHLP